MITRLDLEDYGRFRKASLEFGPFTVVLGANEAGKTTVFDALFDALCAGSRKENLVPWKRLAGRYGALRRSVLTWKGEPFSFTDLIELIAAAGSLANAEPQELPDVTVVPAGEIVTVTQQLPPNRVLVIRNHTLYANPASNSFLLSLSLNGQPVFENMPMSVSELPLSGPFLGAVTSSIAWTLDNSAGSAEVAFTEQLQGVYVQQTVWNEQILPAILHSIAATLAQGAS